MAAVAGPETPRTEGARPASAGGLIPWRRATTPRVARTTQSSGTITTSQQAIEVTIEGTGFMTGLVVELTVTTAGNGANVAYQADAPWIAFSSIILSDTTGELVNVDGFSLYLLNRYFGLNHTVLDEGSSDTNIYQAVTGAGATGGSIRTLIRVPVATNTREFTGLVGNQDRAMKYQLRTDVNSSGNIYSTAPTNAGTFVINRYYESATVPGRQNTQGIPQQILPPKFGIQHFSKQTLSDSAPVGGSTVNHYLRRTGNTLRGIILVFRANGSRTTAESNMPTLVQLLLGDTPIFTESTAYRRWLMRKRFGVDAIAGTLVYDWRTDVLPIASGEFGLDYLWTAGLVNMQFAITYPSGFGSTNNTLLFVTDELIVPDHIDLYAPAAV